MDEMNLYKLLQKVFTAPKQTFNIAIRTVFKNLHHTLIFYQESNSNFTSKYIQIGRKKEDYLLREDFPRTTGTLIVNDITELDPQIVLNRDNLRHLNLSNIQISFLPKELGNLPHLEKLLLSHNCLGNNCLEISKWEWMEQVAISQSLKELNISNNNLTELPLQVGKLQSLICLDVSQNLLTKVPQIIGTLRQLKYLDVSKNCLSYLPGTMRGMELCRLYVEDNLFRDFRAEKYRSTTPKVMNLVDLAAKAVKNYRISYNNLPSTWVRYLDNKFCCKFCCICRNICFHSDRKEFKLLLEKPYHPLSLSNVCCLLSDETDKRILFKCYFCSSKCYTCYDDTMY